MNYKPERRKFCKVALNPNGVLAPTPTYQSRNELLKESQWADNVHIITLLIEIKRSTTAAAALSLYLGWAVFITSFHSSLRRLSHSFIHLLPLVLFRL